MVSVAALLRPARWCQGRRRDIGGPLPCEATANDQSPPPTGGLTRRVRLDRLWQELPETARHEALTALGRMVTRALRPPPDGPEVAHEDR
jgi:hypothetical protein